MSVKGIHWAQQMRGVCPYRKALLYALGERHHKDQNIVIADQIMLADDAGMSSRTVRKYLRLLEQDGLVFPRVVGLPGGGRVSHYTLAFGRTRPLLNGSVRKDVPVREKEKYTTSVRKKAPDQKDARNGKHVPDQSGSCVPFPKDTKIHEVSSSKEREASPKAKPTYLPETWEPKEAEIAIADELHFTHAQFEDAIREFRTYWAGEAARKTKAARKTDWDLTFRNSLRKVSGWWSTTKQPKSNLLNKPDALEPDWPVLLKAWVETGHWPAALGPKPHEQDYEGPLEPLRPLIAGKRPDHPVIAAILAKLEKQGALL